MTVVIRNATRLVGAGLDLAFVALVTSVLAAVVVGRLVPISGHPTLVVAGGSMSPAIEVGSAIVVETIDPAELAVGDVVSLRDGPHRATYTHRITRIVERDGGRWLETRGDANDTPDPALTPDTAVIGRVTLVLPWLGFAIALLAQPTGVLSVLALAAALLIARGLLASTTDPAIRRQPVSPREPDLRHDPASGPPKARVRAPRSPADGRRVSSTARRSRAIQPN